MLTSWLLSKHGREKAVPIAPAPIITIFDIYSFKNNFLKIKKIDISSILPIIIKIIKLIFDDVNKKEKFKFSRPYIPELTVFVRVSIESLKDCSNPILSKIRRLDKINKLKKNEINIKKEIFILSSVILISELNIVLLIILLGLINLIISNEVILVRI